MAKIPLTGGFSTIPEGFYIFKITEVEYDEKFGKLKIRMETADGRKHMETFKLLTEKGQVNEGAANAFSILAKTALNDFERDEIDDQELVGRFFKASIVHTVTEGNDGKTRTYAHLGYDKEPADGFEGEAPGPAPAPAPAPEFDLMAFLKS